MAGVHQVDWMTGSHSSYGEVGSIFLEVIRDRWHTWSGVQSKGPQPRRISIVPFVSILRYQRLAFLHIL